MYTRDNFWKDFHSHLIWVNKLKSKYYLMFFILNISKATLRAWFGTICVQKQPLEVFCKKGVLRNFAKFTRKHLLKGIFLQAALLKKVLQHRCFSVNFVNFLRTPVLQNISGGCFLIINSVFMIDETNKTFVWNTWSLFNTVFLYLSFTGMWLMWFSLGTFPVFSKMNN